MSFQFPLNIFFQLLPVSRTRAAIAAFKLLIELYISLFPDRNMDRLDSIIHPLGPPLSKGSL